MKLLAFLNPDGILTDFLDAGKDGVEGELQEVLSDHYRFFEAIGELERFSIIGRQNDILHGQKITMHRLVQSVIREEMSAEQFSSTTGAVIGLCDTAFPDGDYADQKIRFQGRRFQDQVLVPLSAIVQTDSYPLWRVLLRVGRFLRDDGRYYKR